MIKLILNTWPSPDKRNLHITNTLRLQNVCFPEYVVVILVVNKLVTG